MPSLFAAAFGIVASVEVRSESSWICWLGTNHTSVSWSAWANAATWKSGSRLRSTAREAASQLMSHALLAVTGWGKAASATVLLVMSYHCKTTLEVAKSGAVGKPPGRR